MLDGTPLTVSGCGAPVRMSAGTHSCCVRATEQYTATRLTLRPGTSAPGEADSAESVTERDVRGRAAGRPAGASSTWQRSTRRCWCVPENVNAGWRATLGGRRLTPVRVDGWMQGYLRARGRGRPGHARASHPNRLYQAGLASAGLLALLLVGGAVLVAAPRGASATDARARAPLAPAVRGRGPGAGACRPWPPGALLGGPAFAAGLLLGDLGRRRIGDAGAVGAVLVGVVGAWPRASWRASGRATAGLPPAWCDVLAGAGIGLAAAVLADPRPAAAAGEPAWLSAPSGRLRRQVLRPVAVGRRGCRRWC